MGRFEARMNEMWNVQDNLSQEMGDLISIRGTIAGVRALEYARNFGDIDCSVGDADSPGELTATIGQCNAFSKITNDHNSVALQPFI